jgi:3-oxoacyl-[acyl-carrier-protein] synthase II
VTAGREPVAVVGSGVKAPGGCTVDELWESACAGASTARRFVDPRLPADTGLLVCLADAFDVSPYLPPAQARRSDRATQLAVGAAADAMAALAEGSGALPVPERCAVVCGVGLGATATYETYHEALLSGGLHALHPLTIPMVMPSAMAAALSLLYGFRGPCLTVSTACASGANAIGEGVELLRRGAADLVLAGGVDSMVTYNALCSFLRLGVMSANVEHPELASRPFDVERDGFVMGEGAGFVLLARQETAGAAGWPVLGTVLGYGTNADAHHLVAPSPDGAGALACMRLALDDAGIGAGQIAHVSAHGTSTVLNDRAEAEAMVALFGPQTPPVTALKGTTGHLVGGSGAVEAVLALRTAATGLVPPVAGLRTLDPGTPVDVVMDKPRQVEPGLALSTSYGFGGTNAALVLGPPP